MKEQIAELLKNHKGKSRAITVQRIVDTLDLGSDNGLTNPVARKAIRELIEDGMPIGSCGKGYYLLVTKEEFDEYLKNLHGRIAGIRKRIIKVMGAFRPER